MESLRRYIRGTVLVLGLVPFALSTSVTLAITASGWLVALAVGVYLGLWEVLAIGVAFSLLVVLPVGLAFGVLAALG